MFCGCSNNYLNGRKCLFCGSFKVNKTARRYVKCHQCKRQKSLAQLRCEIEILKGFYQQVPAYRLAFDLVVNPKTPLVGSINTCDGCSIIMAELEGTLLSGEIELDEAYFGGRRKGKRGATTSFLVTILSNYQSFFLACENHSVSLHRYGLG